MKKQIVIQSAFERMFENEIITVIDKGEKNTSKDIILNGSFFEAEGEGIEGGIYLVYYKQDDLEKPYLIINVHSQEDVTEKVEVQHRETIASIYTDNKMGDTCIPIQNRK